MKCKYCEYIESEIFLGQTNFGKPRRVEDIVASLRYHVSTKHKREYRRLLVQLRSAREHRL
jgi:hypothetical protein